MAKTVLIILITILFTFLSLSYAQSQPQTPGLEITNEQRIEKPTQNNQEATQKQQGTEQIPSVVKILLAPKDKADAERDAQERNEKATNERWLMYSTCWLAVATSFLAFFTGYLWWFNLKLWKTTHAAFIAANRPRLRIRRVHSAPKIVPVWMYVANVGGSDASDIKFHAVFTLKANNHRQAPWIENLSKSIWHGPIKLLPGEEAAYELRSNPDVPVDDYGVSFNIASTEQTLSIIGKVRYIDANKTERETGFGWVYDSGTGEFSKPGKDDQYNYED